jgi:phosphatidate cytidylyltransferase
MVRLVSGVVLGVAALAAVTFLPPLALRVLAVGVALVAAHEYLGLARAAGRGPTPLVVDVFVAAVCWLVGGPTPGAPSLLVAALAVLLVEVLFRARSLGEASASVAAGVYIGLPLGALVAIHRLWGRNALLLLIGTVVVSDSAQYYSGRLLGRHYLAPAVSPKKTIEGAVGGLLFGTAAMALAGPRVFPTVSRPALVVVGMVVVILGICGDLFESALKRSAGVKDSATLIPGHGGVLDRIDALLFAAPAFYLLLEQLM